MEEILTVYLKWFRCIKIFSTGSSYGLRSKCCYQLLRYVNFLPWPRHVATQKPPGITKRKNTGLVSSSRRLIVFSFWGKNVGHIFPLIFSAVQILISHFVKVIVGWISPTKRENFPCLYIRSSGDCNLKSDNLKWAWSKQRRDNFRPIMVPCLPKIFVHAGLKLAVTKFMNAY